MVAKLHINKEIFNFHSCFHCICPSPVHAAMLYSMGWLGKLCRNCYIVLNYSHTDDVFMTFALDGENFPAVLSEVEMCRCVLLNQCDRTSCSDGISMIIATKLFMYKWITIKCNCPTQVQMVTYYFNFVVICELDCMCVCIYYFPHTIQVHFIFFMPYSLIFPFYPLLGHDFLHVYKIIWWMLPEAL
jgi:hypothetical protein